MVSHKVPSPAQPLAFMAGDLARFPDQPKIPGPNDDASSRMGDEGCPNESQSIDDATGLRRGLMIACLDRRLE